MRMNWIHFKSTFLLIKFKLNIFPSSEISIVPLPAGSEFLAIFRVSNVTSESQQPDWDWREGGRGLILHPQDTGVWEEGRGNNINKSCRDLSWYPAAESDCEWMVHCRDRGEGTWRPMYPPCDHLPCRFEMEIEGNAWFRPRASL